MEKHKIIKETYLAGIKESLLQYFEDNKEKFLTLKQLSQKFWAERLWIWDYRFMPVLANAGLKARITTEIHNLRNNGYPIVSSATKGKGYTLLDPNRADTPKNWDSKFLANEKFRELIPKSERNIDEELFVKCYEKCKNPEIKRQMEKVAIRWKISLRKKEEESK